MPETLNKSEASGRLELNIDSELDLIHDEVGWMVRTKRRVGYLYFGWGQAGELMFQVWFDV